MRIANYPGCGHRGYHKDAETTTAAATVAEDYFGYKLIYHSLLRQIHLVSSLRGMWLAFEQRICLIQ